MVCYLGKVGKKLQKHCNNANRHERLLTCEKRWRCCSSWTRFLCVFARWRTSWFQRVYDHPGTQTAVVWNEGRIPGQHDRYHLLAGKTLFPFPVVIDHLGLLHWSLERKIKIWKIGIISWLLATILFYCCGCAEGSVGLIPLGIFCVENYLGSLTGASKLSAGECECVWSFVSLCWPCDEGTDSRSLDKWLENKKLIF